jgi:hypothetical protein
MVPAMHRLLEGSSRAPALALVVVRRTTTPTMTRLSAWAVAAVVLAALLIVVCLAWGAARWLAYEPRWTVSLRHSLAEAGWRLAGTWKEFADWIRLGR